MRVTVIEPAEPVVSWEEAAVHLRLDGDDEQQAYVEALIAAATGAIDGPDGSLGRAIGVQTLEARFDGFPCDFGGGLHLPCRPVKTLVSIQYLDGSNVLATLPVNQCELLGPDLVTLGGAAWPSVYLRREAVRIRYIAGYETLPPPIRAAILLMVGDLFNNRDTTTAGAVSAVPMSTTVERLLAPYRVFA